MSKIISASALIVLAILAFVAMEKWDVRTPDTDRIRHQCEKENITDLQVRQCRIRLALQTRHDESLRVTLEFA